jgi:FAD/FMN-containing dehydrogenase
MPAAPLNYLDKQLYIKDRKMSLAHLCTLLPAEDIISPGSALYAAESSTWSLAKQKHPRIVLRPSTVETLAACVKYLATTDLSWKVRSQGYGSSSATDVLISLTAFDQFEFIKESDDEAVVYVGAGQSWGTLLP